MLVKSWREEYLNMRTIDLFYQYQAGFLPGPSSVYQLLETYHSIVQNIDEGKLCCMVLRSLQGF